MHYAFDFLQAVKVTKSGHHLLLDQASKGNTPNPGLTSKTSLHACLQRLTRMQISLWCQTRNRPMREWCPLLAKIYLSEKNILGLGELKNLFAKLSTRTSLQIKWRFFKRLSPLKLWSLLSGAGVFLKFSYGLAVWVTIIQF